MFVHENVSFEMLPAYYAAASVTVVPSINERLALVWPAIESMAAGTPVILADVGGGPELLNNGQVSNWWNQVVLTRWLRRLQGSAGMRNCELFWVSRVGRMLSVIFSNEATLKRMEAVLEVKG